MCQVCRLQGTIAYSVRFISSINDTMHNYESKALHVIFFAFRENMFQRL
jgi:hypothetical protein